MNEDEGRTDQKSSLRIKLFKETSRQVRQSAPEPGRSVREEWDRRQSVRTRFEPRMTQSRGLVESWRRVESRWLMQRPRPTSLVGR